MGIMTAPASFGRQVQTGGTYGKDNVWGTVVGAVGGVPSPPIPVHPPPSAQSCPPSRHIPPPAVSFLPIEATSSVSPHQLLHPSQHHHLSREQRCSPSQMGGLITTRSLDQASRCGSQGEGDGSGTGGRGPEAGEEALSSGLRGGWGRGCFEGPRQPGSPSSVWVQGACLPTHPLGEEGHTEPPAPGLGETLPHGGQYLCPLGGGHRAPLLRGAGPLCACQRPWGPPGWAWGAGCSRGCRRGASAGALRGRTVRGGGAGRPSLAPCLGPRHVAQENGRRLGSLTTGRRASLPSRVKAEALGSSREAGPLTLDGGLAGLAHKLVDGGQGLWLALEGRTGHVASGLSSPSQCLPVLPQGRPKPQTPHTHLLSSLPLGPRQPLSGRKRRSIWTPWPPAHRAPQPKASCGIHPRSPQRTEDPPLPLREGASLPPGPHPACRPRSAPPRPPEPTSPHLPPTLSVLGRAGGSLGSLPCELSAGLALPTCQSQDTRSGQRGQVCTHVTPPLLSGGWAG